MIIVTKAQAANLYRPITVPLVYQEATLEEMILRKKNNLIDSIVL